MTPAPPVVIAVIGPVEPALLTAWTAHYRRLGVERFRVAFHFPDHVPDTRQHDLLTVGRALGITHAHVRLGGHLTRRLLNGDPRKIVLARAGVTVASGNHRAPEHKPDPGTLACVHHFKWRSGVLDDLRRRVERFTSGQWAAHTPAVRDEASRLLAHIDRNGGRIDVADTRLGFRHVTLDHLPNGWATEARSITAAWRPRPSPRRARHGPAVRR